jgi:hypothetical protein
MNETQETRTVELKPVLEWKDRGAASQLTRGSPIQYPWFEMSAPPYNRQCPIC